MLKLKTHHTIPSILIKSPSNAVNSQEPPTSGQISFSISLPKLSEIWSIPHQTIFPKPLPSHKSRMGVRRLQICAASRLTSALILRLPNPKVFQIAYIARHLRCWQPFWYTRTSMNLLQHKQPAAQFEPML